VLESQGQSTASNQMEELGDLVVDLPTLLHESRDLLDGMNHSSVISTAELPGDGGIAEVGELADTRTCRSGGP